MDNTQIFEEYYFEFVKNFGNLIGVKGGEKHLLLRLLVAKILDEWQFVQYLSSGKSVSRCDPAEREANEEAHGSPAESARPKRKSTVSLFI